MHDTQKLGTYLWMGTYTFVGDIASLDWPVIIRNGHLSSKYKRASPGPDVGALRLPARVDTTIAPSNIFLAILIIMQIDSQI
jgi:hypothetical protein